MEKNCNRWLIPVRRGSPWSMTSVANITISVHRGRPTSVSIYYTYMAARTMIDTPAASLTDSEWGKYLKLVYGDISRLRYPFITRGS